MKKLLSVLLCVCLILPVMAVHAESTMTATLSEDGKTATISGTGVLDPNRTISGLETSWRKQVQEVIVNKGFTEVRNGLSFSKWSWPNLRRVTIYADIDTYDRLIMDNSSIEEVYLRGNTRMISRAFCDCPKLTTVELSESLETIENYCFLGCDALETITLPKSLQNTKSYCFQDCASLKNVTFPVGLQTIGNYNFLNCPALQEVTLPCENLTIGHFCFMQCENLHTLNVQGNLTMGARDFKDTPLQSVFFGENAKTLHIDFDRCRETLRTVTLSEGVERITNNGFEGFSYLEMLHIPASVQYISDGAVDCAICCPSKDTAAYVYAQVNQLPFAICGEKPTVPPLPDAPVTPDAPVKPKRGHVIAVSSQMDLDGNLDVPVRLLENPGYVAISTKIRYDTNALELVSVEDCGMFGEGNMTVSGDLTASKVTILWMDALSEGMTEDGTLCILHFRAKNLQGDVSRKLYYSSVGYTNALEDISMGGGQSTWKLPKGDVNTDGIINLKDVVLLRRDIVGGWDVNIEAEMADVYPDGKLDGKDVVLLTRFVAGWDVTLG